MRTAFSASTILVFALTLTVAGCEQPARSSETASAPAPPPSAAQPAAQPVVRAVVPTGPVQSIPAVAETELQEAAAVSQLHAIPEQDAKVFSISGGDPAVNGLVTYLGLYVSSAEGWRSYPIGDFAEWKVAEVTDEQVVLDVRQDTATPEGTIQSRSFRVMVKFSWVDEMPAPSIQVTQGR